MLATQQKWCHHLQQVQSLIPHKYIVEYLAQLCTVYHTVVQQSVRVYYCCFHLTSGASTAVGPYIVHRNRKRLLLSQSTLR